MDDEGGADCTAYESDIPMEGWREAGVTVVVTGCQVSESGARSGELIHLLKDAGWHRWHASNLAWPCHGADDVCGWCGSSFAGLGLGSGAEKVAIASSLRARWTGTRAAHGSRLGCRRGRRRCGKFARTYSLRQ